MNENSMIRLTKGVGVTITLRPIHLKRAVIGVLIVLFAYMVVLDNGPGVPIPSEIKELYMNEQIGGEELVLLAREMPEFIINEAKVAILHQASIRWGGPIHQKWLWAAMIITVSGFLWAAVICFVCVPKGFRLKEDNLTGHMAFSAVLASVSLFQMVQSLRSDPEDFFWAPWLVMVLAALAIRACVRIRSGKRTLGRELIFHLPWLVGLVVPHLLWFEPFWSMNHGTPIYLPISEYYVNSYTVGMNLAMVVVSLGFIPEILSERKKEIA